MMTGKRNTAMKWVSSIGLAGALLASGLGSADEPAADGTPAVEAQVVPEAASLGTVEAILDYCVRLDASAAEKYRQKARAMSQGADDETLVQIRDSNEYRQAHGEMDEFLAKIDVRNAKKVCSQHLAQNP